MLRSQVLFCNCKVRENTCVDLYFGLDMLSGKSGVGNADWTDHVGKMAQHLLEMYMLEKFLAFRRRCL